MKQRNNRKAECVPSYTRNVTADHAIAILMLFNEEHPSLTAEEVANHLGMSRSTTYRYLLSLRSYGLLEEGTGSSAFRLGPAVFRLARIARQGLGLSEIALPVMHELVARTGETALLTRRSGNHVVCVEHVASPHSVRLSYEHGQILSLHAGASAKIVLAYLKPAEIEAVLNSAALSRYTMHTVTDPAVLDAQLRDIRAQGYAVSDGEVDVDVRGVAAPILGANKQIVAGISVAGPVFRLNATVLPTVLAAVQEAGHMISQRLRDLNM